MLVLAIIEPAREDSPISPPNQGTVTASLAQRAVGATDAW